MSLQLGYRSIRGCTNLVLSNRALSGAASLPERVVHCQLPCIVYTAELCMGFATEYCTAEICLMHMVLSLLVGQLHVPVARALAAGLVGGSAQAGVLLMTYVVKSEAWGSPFQQIQHPPLTQKCKRSGRVFCFQGFARAESIVTGDGALPLAMRKRRTYSASAASACLRSKDLEVD